MSQHEKQLKADATKLVTKVVTQIFGQQRKQKQINDAAKRVAAAIPPHLHQQASQNLPACQ